MARYLLNRPCIACYIVPFSIIDGHVFYFCLFCDAIYSIIYHIYINQTYKNFPVGFFGVIPKVINTPRSHD